jgi:hypothetical protein
MDPAVVGNHIRGHREHPIMPGLGQHVDTDAGERAARGDKGVVDAMYASDETPDAGEVQPRDGRAGEHAGTVARRYERADGFGRDLDVGIEVHPRKRTAHVVADRDRSRLPRHRCLDHACVEPTRDRGRFIGARVRNHNHVELARLGGGQQPGQIRGHHRRLVVRRDDDARDRPPVIAVRDGTSVHSNLRILRHHDATHTPLERISVPVTAERSNRAGLLSNMRRRPSLGWAGA